jgi:hypothetical protein
MRATPVPLDARPRGDSLGMTKLGMIPTIVLAMALAAAPADAGQSKVPGQAATKTTVSGPIGTTRTVMVSCPRGRTAIWGGWRTGKVSPSEGALGIFESRRAGSRQWRVSAQVVAAEGSHRLQVLAFCSRGRRLPAVARTTELTLMGSSGAIGGAARCPAHKRAVSGGFHLAGDVNTSTFVAGTYRVRGRAWRTEVRGPSGSTPRLTATVYCGPASALVAREGSARIQPDPFTVGGIDTPPCPGLRPPLSGGFRFLPNAPTDMPLIPTALSRFQSDAVVGFLVFGPSDETIKAFSYCR